MVGNGITALALRIVARGLVLVQVLHVVLAGVALPSREDLSGGGGPAHEEATLGQPRRMEWQSCPLIRDAGHNAPHDSELQVDWSALAWEIPLGIRVDRGREYDEFGAECGYLTVPLDWNHAPAGNNSLQYFARRIFHKKRGNMPATHQVWLVQGGPGNSGEGMVPMAITLLESMGTGVDVFIPDHRGTGHSSDMDELVRGAKSREDAFRRIEEGGGRFFTTTNAARDLIAMIECNRESRLDASIDKQPRLSLYGASYGSYLVDRYLHVLMTEREGAKSAAFPDEVALDGHCPPALCRMDAFDTNWDYIGREVMAKCSENEFCSGKFGAGGALAALEAIGSGHIAQNTCTTLFPKELFLEFLGRMVGGAATIAMPPGLVYRYLRCSTADVDFLKSLPIGKTPPPSVVSTTLQENIVLSEMFTGSNRIHPPRPSELDARAAEALFRVEGGKTRQLAALYDDYPRYPSSEDPHWLSYGVQVFGGPVLVMNGDLDPQTPVFWARQASRLLNKNPRTKFVEVPGTPHVTVLQSAVTHSNRTCGMEMLASFFGSGLDDTCLEKLPPLDFECRRGPCQSVLHGRSLWGDDVS